MKNKTILFTIVIFSIIGCHFLDAKPAIKPRVSELGLTIGQYARGYNNAITDVKGVKVGHFTLFEGENIRTGVTAILPHGDNIFQEKVPAAMYIANGFGKLTGISQVAELGNIETPIILTNTLSVPVAAAALVDYTLATPGNQEVWSVNPIVGETNDMWLNDIRGCHIKKEHVLKAISAATPGPVAEGCVGAGTGTVCFGFKGGIGTASRVITFSMGTYSYTLGVLVQTNFGHWLEIKGCPIGRELAKMVGKETTSLNKSQPNAGSCMIVIATDAPLNARQLQRLAKRSVLALTRTGGTMSNGSGDYVIAFSTAPILRIPYNAESPLMKREILRDDSLSPLFAAVIEACEEAILNSLCKAVTVTGRKGHTVQALPIEKVRMLLQKYGLIK